MMFLKFQGKQNDLSASRMVCTKEYSCVDAGNATRVYYEKGIWEAVGANDWISCFVMSETGKTIDRIGSM